MHLQTQKLPWGACLQTPLEGGAWALAYLAGHTTYTMLVVALPISYITYSCPWIMKTVKHL